MILLAQRNQDAIRLLRVPMGSALGALVQGLKPVASPVINLVKQLFPEGDQKVIGNPAMQEAFLDDILHGSAGGLHSLFFDILLFSKPWGFTLSEISVPIRFWQGDADPIVPLEHAEKMAQLVPDSTLIVRHAESHLGALMIADDVLEELLAIWADSSRSSGRATQ